MKVSDLQILQIPIPEMIFEPCNDWVLTKNIDPTEIKMSSGLVLPAYEEREDTAVVIAVGPGPASHATGKRVPLSLSPGDVVRTTRKKGRTMYLQVFGAPQGIQEDYNLYQSHEIMGTMAHYEELAIKLEIIRERRKIFIPTTKSKEVIQAELNL